MKKTEYWVAVLLVIVVSTILGTLLACFVLRGVLRDSPSPKGVKAWEIYRVKELNTRVWCLARRAANNHHDITGVSSLISKKNNLKKDYNLHPGDEILLPVFREK